MTAVCYLLSTGLFWFWFRDHWGVVWSLRVLERFNRAAASQRWPFRLAWHGLTAEGAAPGETPEVPDDAAATLAGLLRRFATPERVDRSCQPPDARR